MFTYLDKSDNKKMILSLSSYHKLFDSCFASIRSTNIKIYYRISFLIICFFVLASQTINAQQTSKSSITDQIKMILMSQIDSLHNEFVRMENGNQQKNRSDFHQLIGANDKEIDLFKSSLNKLQDEINNKKTDLYSLQTALNSLQLKKISALPEFYDLVHKTLQKKLDELKIEKNLAEKKSLEPNLYKDKNLESKIKNKNENPSDTLREKNVYQKNQTFKDIESEGLVVDETQTKLGHDFYDLFYQKWDSPQLPNDFTIIISEKPIPSLGTQVSIKINDNEIFQNRLQSRYEQIEELADYAVQLSLNYLQNYEEIQKQLNGDEMKGSGIF